MSDEKLNAILEKISGLENLVKNELKDEEGAVIPEEDIDFDKKEIKSGDIYKVGVLCKVVKKLKLPDGSVNVLVHGMKRYRASEILSETPILKTKIAEAHNRMK